MYKNIETMVTLLWIQIYNYGRNKKQGNKRRKLFLLLIMTTYEEWKDNGALAVHDDND